MKKIIITESQYNYLINNSHKPTLILESCEYKFTEPWKDFREKPWKKLDENHKIWKYIESKLPHYDGKRKPKIDKIYQTKDKHYILYLYGGENGSGKWKNYMKYLQKLFSNIDDAWLIDLVNDCPDDCWDIRIGFRVE